MSASPAFVPLTGKGISVARHLSSSTFVTTGICRYPSRTYHSTHSTPMPVLFPRRARRNQSTTATLKDTIQASTSTTFASLFPTAESATVEKSDGQTTSLVTYVEEENRRGNAVLLGWLRHYGCTLCKKQAAEWRDWTPELKSIGSNLSIALIGNGSIAQAVEFKDEMQWPADLFTDPSRRTYAALQFTNRKRDLFTKESLAITIESMKKYPQSWTRKPTDPFQQGGAILVDSQGVVSFFHADRVAGDHTEKTVLFEAVRTALAS